MTYDSWPLSFAFFFKFSRIFLCQFRHSSVNHTWQERSREFWRLSSTPTFLQLLLVRSGSHSLYDRSFGYVVLCNFMFILEHYIFFFFVHSLEVSFFIEIFRMESSSINRWFEYESGHAWCESAYKYQTLPYVAEFANTVSYTFRKFFWKSFQKNYDNKFYIYEEMSIHNFKKPFYLELLIELCA